MGRILVVIGGLMVAAGLFIWAVERLFPGLGRLPGDIVIQRGNFTFFFPIATSLLLSVALTLLFWLIRRLGG